MFSCLELHLCFFAYLLYFIIVPSSSSFEPVLFVMHCSSWHARKRWQIGISKRVIESGHSISGIESVLQKILLWAETVNNVLSRTKLKFAVLV